MDELQSRKDARLRVEIEDLLLRRSKAVELRNQHSWGHRTMNKIIAKYDRALADRGVCINDDD